MKVGAAQRGRAGDASLGFGLNALGTRRWQRRAPSMTVRARRRGAGGAAGWRHSLDALAGPPAGAPASSYAELMEAYRQRLGMRGGPPARSASLTVDSRRGGQELGASPEPGASPRAGARARSLELRGPPVLAPALPSPPRAPVAPPPGGGRPALAGVSMSPFTALGVPEGPRPPTQTCARARARAAAAAQAARGARASRSLDGLGSRAPAPPAEAGGQSPPAMMLLPPARARAASADFVRVAGLRAAGEALGGQIVAGPVASGERTRARPPVHVPAAGARPAAAAAAAAARALVAPAGRRNVGGQPTAAAAAAAAAASAFGMPAAGGRRRGAPQPHAAFGGAVPAAAECAAAAPVASAQGRALAGAPALPAALPADSGAGAPGAVAPPSAPGTAATPLAARPVAAPRPVAVPSLAAPNLAAAIAAHSLLVAPAAPLSAVLGPAAGRGRGSLITAALARLSAGAGGAGPRRGAPAAEAPPRSGGPSPGSPGTPPAVEAPVCGGLADGHADGNAAAHAAGAPVHEAAHPAADPRCAAAPREHGLALLPPGRPGCQGVYPAPLPLAAAPSGDMDDLHDTYGAHARLGGASPPAAASPLAPAPRRRSWSAVETRASAAPALALLRTPSGALLGSANPRRGSLSGDGRGKLPPRSPRFAPAPVLPAFDVLASLPEGDAAGPSAGPGPGPGAGDAAAALGEQRASYLSKTLRYLAHARLQDAAAVTAEAVPSGVGGAAPPSVCGAAGGARGAEPAGEGAITRAKRVLAAAAAACPDHVYAPTGKVGAGDAGGITALLDQLGAPGQGRRTQAAVLDTLAFLVFSRANTQARRPPARTPTRLRWGARHCPGRVELDFLRVAGALHSWPCCWGRGGGGVGGKGRG